MTNSEPPLNPPTAYVWVWLPDATEPVVAGRLDDRGAVATFSYGRSYLDNPDAVALYLPDLPLESGETPPASTPPRSRWPRPRAATCCSWTDSTARPKADAA